MKRRFTINGTKLSDAESMTIRVAIDTLANVLAEGLGFETALLKDVDNTYYYGASCRSCLHISRLDVTKLRERLGKLCTGWAE